MLSVNSVKCLLLCFIVIFLLSDCSTFNLQELNQCISCSRVQGRGTLQKVILKLFSLMRIKLHTGNRSRVGSSRDWRCLDQLCWSCEYIKFNCGLRIEEGEESHVGFFLSILKMWEHMVLMWSLLKTRLYVCVWDPPFLDWSICARAEASRMNIVYITQYVTCYLAKRRLHKQWMSMLENGLSNWQTATSCFKSPCTLIKSSSK